MISTPWSINHAGSPTVIVFFNWFFNVVSLVVLVSYRTVMLCFHLYYWYFTFVLSKHKQGKHLDIPQPCSKITL